ncbi:MAG: hypothetical protein Q8R39_02380 [bacterium]|nr:hypothetical protein [bacterium]MDZ4284856.1 hypothetical protein [Patescibacteria group bacterium]
MSPGEKQPFEESTPHLLRLEMDEPSHTLREIPNEDPVDRAIRAIEAIRTKALALPPQRHDAFANVLDTNAERIVRERSERERAVRNITQFLNSIRDPERLSARRSAIEKQRPDLESHQRLADWEMFLADHIYSNPHLFRGARGESRLGALDRVLTNSKLDIAGRPFDLSGIKGLAGAVSLIGSKKYVPFFPDPLLDVLLKVDALGHREDTDQHILAQVKARRGLAPSTPIIDTPRAFFERRDVRNNFDGERLSRLADDALVLELTAEALSNNYRGKFTPLLIVMPSFNPGDNNPDFDAETGLPKRETFARINWPKGI